MKISFIVDYTDQSRMELARCLDSIDKQTEKDIETIVVGFDSDYMICAPDVFRAKGMALGEYLCVLPASACISPFFGEKMLAMCKEHSTDSAICGWQETEKNTPLDRIPVPLMLYRAEKLTAEQLAKNEIKDMGFNRLQRKRGKKDGDVAVTAEPLVFVTKSK
ncbi:MAG: hypothetical protein II977_03910 [Oscillospiraceae bacterium]|nr:hypothetical protein [Oscillospiraceae bacterium]